jgi:hypothetical protein
MFLTYPSFLFPVFILQDRTGQDRTGHDRTGQYSTVSYRIIQYSTVQYSAVQYSTIQFSTVPAMSLLTRGGGGVDMSLIYVSLCGTLAPIFRSLTKKITWTLKHVVFVLQNQPMGCEERD